MKFKKEDIKVLLINSTIQASNNYSNVNPNLEIEVYENLGGISFVNVQVNSIRKLYVQLSPKDKKLCESYLLDTIEPGNSPLVAATVLNVLAHIGLIEKALKKIKAIPVNNSNNLLYKTVLLELSEILSNEWNIFTLEQIDKMHKWIEEVWEGKNTLGQYIPYDAFSGPREGIKQLYRKLNIIKTYSLKREIFSETSQEITSDEKAMKLEFKRHNFPDYLSETLDKIDIQISTANDNFDFKGCMGLIRSFLESLFKYIAETLDSEDGREIDGTDSEKAARFFVEKRLISANEKDLITSLRHFISNEGVHRLKSRPDDARLSRNMTIEVGLYLLLRLKDIKG